MTHSLMKNVVWSNNVTNQPFEYLCYRMCAMKVLELIIMSDIPRPSYCCIATLPNELRYLNQEDFAVYCVVCRASEGGNCTTGIALENVYICTHLIG